MAYQGNNATFYHGSMSIFDASNLPGDPMGQGPYGQASNWPGPFDVKDIPPGVGGRGCHLIDGTVGSRYPISYENGAFQPWVTGPKGQNFAECDNYASYNNVGYWGEIWPQAFATPNFQLAEKPPKSKRQPKVARMVGAPKSLPTSDIIGLSITTIIVVCVLLYLASRGNL